MNHRDCRTALKQGYQNKGGTEISHPEPSWEAYD